MGKVFEAEDGIIRNDTPDAPPTGQRSLYPKSDGWYDLDSSGNEQRLTPLYKVYTALITQSGTNDPTATVLENTLGGTVVWTYSDVGNYLGTLTGAFTSNTLIFPVYAGFNSQLYLDTYTTINNSHFPNAINLQTGEIDDYLNNHLIQIRVYP